MANSHLPRLLAVEPNRSLDLPYQFFQSKLELRQVNTVKQAIEQLANNSFQVYSLSASFAPDQQLILLDAFKHSFTNQVIPLLIVVDLSQPVSTIPGTKWSGKLALLPSNASKQLTLLSIDSLLSA